MRNKKVLYPILYVLIMIASLDGAIAQKNVFVGVQGGVSIPNLTATAAESNPLNQDYKSRVGPHIGILAEFQLSKIFSIQTELNYSGQGGKRNGLQALQSQNILGSTAYLYADVKNTSRLNYLQIPILARVNLKLSEKFSFYINGGGFFGYMLAGNQIIDGSSAIYLNKTTPILPESSLTSTTNVMSNLHRANVGIQAALGFSMNAGPGKIFIQGGGNYGFVKLQKDAVNGTNRTGAGLLTVGYAYRIKGN